MRIRLGVIVLVVLTWCAAARPHDIPNARIERSIQADLRPGSIKVDYAVDMAELTLTQDLRSLIGRLPDGTRLDWFRRYGEEVGPLNAKGMILLIDGEQVDWKVDGFDLMVEEHPRFTFHFSAEIPPAGSLRLLDTNYASSEGTSRLAIRGNSEVEIVGDNLPADVVSIPIRPVWQLSTSEERRTKRVDVSYRLRALPTTPLTPEPIHAIIKSEPTGGLTRLLDGSILSPILLVLSAFGLGAVHSLQPGHGKTLVAAGMLGPQGGVGRGVSLGIAATLGHFSSVSILAACLWLTGTTDYPGWNTLILRSAGFVIAAVGFWRIGHHFAPEEGVQTVSVAGESSVRGLLGLGFVSGLVPCWDAVGLVVIAASLDRLGFGMILLVAFSLGMAAVLVVVGAVAGRLSESFATRIRQKRLLLGSGFILAILGCALLSN